MYNSVVSASSVNSFGHIDVDKLFYNFFYFIYVSGSGII